MNLKDLEKALNDAGIKTCVVCGCPFEPYTKRQKTCGSERCKRTYHNKYVRERSRKQRAENRALWNQNHTEAQRKYRAKQRELQRRADELKEVGNRWERQAEFERKISEYGHEYGKRSAEKTLAKVPKIDVTLGGQHDNVHTKDNAE